MALTRIRAQQISNIDYKQAVRVVTTTNVLLDGGAPSSVDNVALSVNSRILVNGQSTQTQNGLYLVQSVGTGSNGTWVRTTDTDATGEMQAGMVVTVTEGNTYRDTLWTLTTNDPIVLGSSNITFQQSTSFNFGNITANGTAILANTVGDAVSFVAGDNISITGNATAKTVTIGTAGTQSTSIFNGTSNVAIASANANVTVGVDGTGNVAVFSVGSTVFKGNVIPSANITYDLGSSTNRWRDLWVANSTIYLGETPLTTTGNTLVVNGLSVITSTNNSSLSLTGNITGGNLLTSGFVSAVGNISGDNLKSNSVSIATNTTDAVFVKDDNLTGWDYSEKSISITAQETGPTGLFFKPDGTEMYIIGSAGDDVNQYTLSTAWDVSTATFTRVSASIGETAPTGVFFKPDGTVMYVIGSTNDTVREFSVSTAWDVSTIAFVRDFSVTAQDTIPQDIWFKPDGTKMYMIGSTNDRVYEYNLGTAWNISTATFLQFFSVATQESAPIAVNFNSDGTKMYVLGQTGLDINRYTLSTPWDISTAVFFNNFYVGFQETLPTGLFINLDAGAAYVVGTSSDTVFQYNTITDGIELTSNSGLFIDGSLYTNKNLVVTGNTRVDGTLRTAQAATLAGAIVGGAISVSGAATLSTTTGAINLGTSQTTGTFIVGGTAQTGEITVGQSTGVQTVNLATGATVSGNTKTVNIGTSGVAGSNTIITIGSANSTATTVNGTLSATGNISATGAVTSASVVGGVITGTSTSVTGTTTAASVVGGVITGTSTSVTGTTTAASVVGGVMTGTSVNVTGSVTGASLAGTITTAAQTNITSVGTLGSLSVTGNVTAGNLSGTNIVGTLTTAAQTNITSVGTLGSLSVTGNVQGGNLRTAGLVSATGSITGASVVGGVITGTSTSVSGTQTAASTVGGVITGSSVSVTGAQTAASTVGGVITGTSTSVTGTTTAASVVGGVITGTSTSVTGTTTAASVVGGVITGTSVSVSGNITGANLTTAGTATVGGLTISGNTIVSSGPTLTIDPNASGGVDGLVVIAGNLQVNGNTTTINSNVVSTNDLTINFANNAINSSAANGAGIEAGPIGAAYLTFLYNSTSNVWTSSGGLSAVGTVTAASTVGGVITGTSTSVTGTTTAASVVGGVITGTSTSVTGTQTAASTVGGVITGTSTSVTGTTTAASVVGGVITGTSTSVTGTTTAASVVGGVITGSSVSVTGAVTGASLAGTITTAAQTNITSVGTLGSLSVTGNVQGGNLRTAGLVSATGSITGASVVGGVITGTSVSVTGAVTGASVVGGVMTGSSVSVTGAVTGASVVGGVITGTSTSVTGTTTAASVVGGVITGSSTSVTGNITGGNLISNGTISGVGAIQLAASLRSNRNLNGGGTITVNGSGYVGWSSRFIVISNGNGTDFSTGGYFDINCPTSGTITGVGGAGNVTATAAGIPLTAWQALYYILPIGQGQTSLAANFRVVSYTGTLDIPAEWVLICVVNGDTSTYYFNNGITILAGNSSVGYQTTSTTAYSVPLRDANGNINATSHTGTSTSVTGTTTAASVVGGVITGTSVSVSGAVTGASVVGGVITGTSTSVSGTTTAASIVGGVITGTSTSVTGTTTAASVVGGVITGTSVSVSGAVTGAALTGTSLTVSTGNITGGNLILSGAITDTAELIIQTTAANGNITLTPNGTGNVNTGANVSVTGRVTAASVVGGVITGSSTSVTGTTTAASVVGGVITGSSASVTGAVTGASLVGTLTTAAQTNITSVGTLTSLSVSGNVQGGNLRTAGTTTTTGVIVDPWNLGSTNIATVGGGSTASGKTLLGWNRSSGGGEFSIVVNRNGGSTGGLALYEWANTLTNTTTAVFNVTAAGVVSATGNITGANLNTAGLVSATGNVNGGNITASGSLGVGTTASASYKLDVAGKGRFLQDAAATTGAIILRASTSNTTSPHLQFVSTDNSAQYGYITINAAGVLSTTSSMVTTGLISATGNVTGGNLNVTGGNIVFTAANPYITASSYIHFPGGAYFNSGIVYVQAGIRARGGIQNDNAAFLTVAGGTSGITYFSGNVGIGTNAPAYNLQVVGSFAATTKSFLIDHPTRANMKLRYGSLEGPENGVYVRGRLTGDTINLPEYWTKLVDPASITVDLTPIGRHQKLYVKEIADNRVLVGNENLINQKIDCFYTVYAERCDVDRLLVEIENNDD